MAVVGKLADLPPGGLMKAAVDGEEVCVANSDGKLFAVSHRCTHLGGPLSGGRVEGGVITCPWHGAKFDLATGKCLAGPGGGTPSRDLKVFKARAENGNIIVEK